MSQEQVDPDDDEGGAKKVRSQPEPSVNKNVRNIRPQRAQEVGDVKVVGLQDGQPAPEDLVLVLFPGEQVGGEGDEEK